MQLVIANISASPVYIRDLYTAIPVGGSVTTERSGSDLASMEGLMEAMDAGSVTVQVTPTAAELASGLLAPPSSIQAQDMAPVAAADVAAGLVLFRKSFAAGAGGSADDVTVYAVNSLPFKFRVLDAWAMISTNIAMSTLNVYTRAAGAGTLVAGPADSGTAGIARMTGPTTSALATPATTEGLFIRRSDNGVAGEVFVLARRES